MRRPPRTSDTRSLLVLAALLLCSISVPSADPTWVSVGPGGGGAWGGIAFDPSDPTGNTLIIGTDVGGAFRTTNGGTTWSNVNAGFDVGPTQSMGQVYWAENFAYANASTVYAATLATLMKSTDGGQSWAPAKPSVTSDTRDWMRYVTVAPSNPQLVFGSFNTRFGEPYGLGAPDNLPGDGCIYRSADGGVTVEHKSLLTNPGTSCVPGDLANARPAVISIVVDPANQNKVLASTTKGIFKSDDAGVTWVPVNSTLCTPNVSPATNCNFRTLVLDVPSNTLYVVLQSSITTTGTYTDPTTWKGGVYKATKASWGTSWTAIPGVNGNNGLQNSGFDQGSSFPNKWTALPGTTASRDTLVKRTGTASVKITAGGGIKGVQSDAVSGIIGGQRYEIGVYAKVTGGADPNLNKVYGRIRWYNGSSEVTSNPICFPPPPAPPVPSDMFSDTTSDPMWRRFEGVAYAPLVATSLRVEFFTQETSGFTNYDDAYVVKSNSLSRADQLNHGGTNYRALIADPANSGTVFVGTWGAVYGNDGTWKTTDGGTTWTRVTRQLPEDLTDTMTDGWSGNNEAQCNLGRDTIEPYYLGIKGIANQSSILYLSTSWQVYKSTDGGAHWTVTTAVADGSGTNRWKAKGETNNVMTHESATEPGNPARFYYGDQDNDLMVTDNAGVSWKIEGRLWTSSFWAVLGYPRGQDGGALIPNTVTSVVADAANHVYVAANSGGLTNVGAVIAGTYTNGSWSWTPVGLSSWPGGGPVSLVKDAVHQFLFASIFDRGVFKYNLLDPNACWEAVYIGSGGTCSATLACTTSSPASVCGDPPNASCVCNIYKIAYEPVHDWLLAGRSDPYGWTDSLEFGVWLSTNHGQSWTKISAAWMDSEPILSITALASGEIYVGTRDNNDDGASGARLGKLVNSVWQWESILSQPRVYGIAAVPGDPDTVYAGSALGNFAAEAPGPGVYRLNRNGQGQWSSTLLSSPGLDNKRIYSLRHNSECQDGFPLIATTLGSGAFITSVVTPAPPLALSGSSPLGGTIVLNWSDASATECGFKVERSAGSNQNYQELAQKAVFNQTSYGDTGLDSGVYYYRIRSFNAAGASSYSNEISVFTAQAPCIHCAAEAGFCDGQSPGTPCGLPACGGTCRSCGGQFDCFKP